MHEGPEIFKLLKNLLFIFLSNIFYDHCHRVKIMGSESKQFGLNIYRWAFMAPPPLLPINTCSEQRVGEGDNDTHPFPQIVKI